MEEEPRVTFGKDWVYDSVIEVFQDDISRFRVLLGADINEEPLQELEDGKIPKLQALQVHNGTVYKWNRPCYGITDGVPHLRIENRVLPAGPTIKDEVANTAFWLGLMNADWPKEYKQLPEHMDFDDVRANFIMAARYGLNIQVKWINNKVLPVDKLILDVLLPKAKQGLQKAKVNQADIDNYLDIIKQRVKSRQTGSQWIIDSFNKLKKKGHKGEALVAITAAMFNRQKENNPVHTWLLASIDEAGHWLNRYGKVRQFMSKNVFTVQESDWVD
jgi:hypothetical protein